MVVVVAAAAAFVTAVDWVCNGLKRIEEMIELQRRRPQRLLANRDSSDLNATAAVYLNVGGKE